jgi:hypothetical protein
MLNKAVSDAKQLMNVLRNLMDYFLEKNSAIGIVDAEVESLLKDLSKPYSITLPTAEAASSLDAYRIYQTEDELQKLLYCAIQKEYSHYKWVHFISAASRKAVINPTLYSELNGQVKECYAINRGQWYELALSGTKYALKFSRPGYMQQEINFIVGQPSPYVEEGANHVINPKSPDEMGLRFKKKVTISLIDGLTNQPIVVGGNAVCITEELTENTSKVVELKANGYKSKTIALDSSKITKAEENLRETLQRDPRTYAPVPERQHYDWEDNNQEESNSKKKRIIYAIIIFIVGAVIGFCISKFMSPRADAKAEANPVLDTLIKENKFLKANIEQLKKDTIALRETIDTKEEEIQKQSVEIEKLKNETKTTSKTTGNSAKDKANMKALEYLNSNREWSLSGMTTASKDSKNVGTTECYKFLKNLVLAENLDDIVNFDGITNTLWTDSIVPLIRQNKDTKKNDIKSMIKKSNKKLSNPQNGELKLLSLYNNLTEL